ncbi:ClpP/crotonase [Lentinus tigrinus ALCF2SS1-7]|uniref:ClpP/crotonase n=1 Tax=Lentinus tigrinus ALCF2SS1-6 TaxID=1328759 RepID=A0A5C2SSI4_9APHY|nr:ClpP/crotonase [Lentinus tigrinus ALCF2SS1-6]RPD79967.1 ClpP/crotonase [Lentinus tigrinus ALCF2SS1-7]
MSTVTLNVSQGIATIAFNSPERLNAINREDYDAFATYLREADKRDDVLVTVWQANGKWFSAGTSVKNRVEATTPREFFLATIAAVNTDVSNALYTHTKILVAALNGPVMGIAAAFLGHFDFIYALPAAWISVPFTFLGIIAEAGSSVTFRNRMGAAKANEVLIWGKKKEAQELMECGFINKVFPDQSVPSFHAEVRKLILAELDGLDPTALLGVKRLIKAGVNDQTNLDAVNLRESYAQAERFASGIPGERFGKIARKELKHKL